MIDRYTIQTSRVLLKDMKKFIKKKRFIKLKEDLQKFKREHLETGRFRGEIVTHLDNDTSKPVYKFRMANRTINVGASNGFRLIYHVDRNNKKVGLHTIYYKKEENLTNSEIIGLIQSNTMVL